MPVKKAIFVVAGFGTRFLPITKAVPKEMLPIVDKPIIQYLVEEAVEAGVQDVIFVTGRGKNSIENHFDKSYELEQTLVEKSKIQLLDKVEKISKLANFAYVRQPIQKGDGHALLCARPFVDPNEPVLVVFPDYLMPRENKTFQKMINFYRQCYETIIATDFVPPTKVSQYGVLKFQETKESEIVLVTDFVEKPKKDAPSNLINNGYAIITPEVWKYLENAESTVTDQEIRVADAYIKMLKEGKKIYALKPSQQGYDCGSQIGFLKATVMEALRRDPQDFQGEFLDFLKSII